MELKNDYFQISLLILAGGYGTRLSPLLNKQPKILAKFNNKTFVDILLAKVSDSGIKKVIFSLGYGAEYIISHLNRNSYPLDINYFVEPMPLGTGGAIKTACMLYDDNSFFVINGDTYLDVNFSEFYAKILEQKSDFGMSVIKVKDVSRFGNVEIDNKGYVVSFLEKGKKGPGYINAGCYFIKTNPYLNLNNVENFSLEYDFFPKLSYGKLISHEVNGLFIDYGTPESYRNALLIFKQKGIIE